MMGGFHQQFGTAHTVSVEAGTVYIAVCVGPATVVVVVVVVRDPGAVVVHGAAGTVVVVILPDPVETIVLVES